MTNLQQMIGQALSVRGSQEQNENIQWFPRNEREAKPQGSSRIKLWQLEGLYHCPVIGTCLSRKELVRLADECSLLADRNNDYALHAEVVGWSKTRNPVAEKLHKLLDRKFANELSQFTACRDEQALLAAWKDMLGMGQVAAGMWVVMTHKHSSDKIRHIVYGDVHMLSHQLGAGQTADLRQLQVLRQEVAGLRAEKLHWQAEQAKQVRMQQEQREQLAALRVQNASLQSLQADQVERLAAYENGLVMIGMGQRLLALQAANEQLRDSAQRARMLEERLQASRHDVADLRKQRDKLAAERSFMERCLSALDTAPANCESSQPCDQCQQQSCRSVLYVGGRASLLAQYRLLAERAGCNLLHHDGGLEESLARLPELIGSADAVICPTDCVSHSAYYKVKAQCKRAGKPCLFIQSASVSGFATALAQIAF